MINSNHSRTIHFILIGNYAIKALISGIFATNLYMVYNGSALHETIGSQVNQIIYVLIQIASLNAISKEKLYCHSRN